MVKVAFALFMYYMLFMVFLYQDSNENVLIILSDPNVRPY
jgi:hypothetical protein